MVQHILMAIPYKLNTENNMSEYKSREALFKDSQSKSDTDWDNWISTLLVNPNAITEKL